MVILNHISCQNEATAVCFSTWNRNAEYTKKTFCFIENWPQFYYIFIAVTMKQFCTQHDWTCFYVFGINHYLYHCIKNVFQFKAESVSTIRIYLPSDGHLSYINKQINFIRRIGLLHYTYNNAKKMFLLLLIINIYNGTWQSNLITSMTRIYILFAIFLWYSMLLIH